MEFHMDVFLIKHIMAKASVQQFTYMLEYLSHLSALGYKSHGGCPLRRTWGDRVSLTE